MLPLSKVKINIIMAAGLRDEIGVGGRLPWTKQRDDMSRFTTLTSVAGCVIMGRKTFDSIGGPLPERTNIVLTTTDLQSTPDVKFVHNMHEAVEQCEALRHDSVFVIGGAAIYGMFIPFADSLFYTRIRWTFPEADSHFAVSDKSVWSVKHTRLYPPDENNQYPYQFANMERINPWSKMMI